MHSYSVDLVTLDDGTTWLRRGDVMIRAMLPANAAWPGVDAPAPVVDVDAVTEIAAPQPPQRKLAPGKGRKQGSPQPPLPRIPSVPQPPTRRAPNAADEAKVKQAKILFETTNKKLKAIAEEVDMKYPTLYGIAQRERWTRQALVGRSS